MFHSIVAILTTAAVALHAILGCCAHHAHSCESREFGLAVVTSEVDNHCSHGHHHRDVDKPSSDEVGNDCGHRHDGHPPHGCDEEDCSFVSGPRSNDLGLMLALAMQCHSFGDAAHAEAIDSQLSLHSAAETPPDPLAITSSARAIYQVWRL